MVFDVQAGANVAPHPRSSMLPVSQTQMSVEEVAMGFIRVANEAMCRPIRALTQVRFLQDKFRLQPG